MMGIFKQLLPSSESVFLFRQVGGGKMGAKEERQRADFSPQWEDRNPVISEIIFRIQIDEQEQVMICFSTSGFLSFLK